MNEIKFDFLNFNQNHTDLLQAIAPCISKKPFSQPGILSVKKVDKEEITQLNQSFSGEDKPTDVLSFSYIDSDQSHGNPDELGDIVVCDEIAQKQAEQAGIPLIDEYAFLTIHGVLHIFGFDHYTETEQQAMEELQEELMACAGFGPRQVSWHE